MGPDAWVQGAVIILAVVQFGVFWYLYRQSKFATSVSSDQALDENTAEVTCPDCGAPNDRTFRYCQQCVTELPGRMNRPGTADNSERSGLS